MAKVDRLGWAAGFAFECYGLRLGVRVNDPAILPRIEELLPFRRRPSDRADVEHLFSFRVGGVREGSSIRDLHLGFVDSSPLVRSNNLGAALNAFAGQIHLLVAALARTHVFVHAGVVAFDGQAVILPGRSRTGKSTLVAALLDEGGTLYSDEFALLLDDGRVEAYPAPLQLRDDNGSTFPQGMRAAESLPPADVRLVVFSEFSRRTKIWRPRSIPPGQAVLSLLDNTVSARYQTARALETLARTVEGAEVLKGRRPEAAAAAPAIFDLLIHTGSPNAGGAPRTLSNRRP